YLYAKLIEKRSYKSFLYEIMIRATKMKQPFEKKVNAQKALEFVKAQTQGEYEDTNYQFDNAVYTKKIHNVTNYIVNDKEDRQQKVVIYIHGGAWFQ
ncbi:alpha/beta hydrolase, partial [Mesorhizobium sp. M8A.F.Ca.ET.173.01.1.1]